ncbi:RDD family protein [Methanobacterium petrolearium]|uniref:RDD family protein n=1 Tax=Methanobacterium petrolearium TaxID=710190 RepID=UPI001AE9232F|nr:RDD family protein [Methanobacterium petrolearium]MBP1946689.1 putative RDD family membrane protein YckC [Methanobacterium petrolearium]BDZ70933.1 hypothetical protein GCM10025861_14500 [Methanobacterium petrolearium]
MQEFWGRRLVALIVDAIFITLFLWVLTAIIYPVVALLAIYPIFNFWLIMLGVIILIYFTLMEGKWSTTLGKGLVNLKVRSIEGTMTYKQAFLRNISKFLWIPLVVDVIIGFATAADGEKGRYLDKVAKTRVVLKEVKTEQLKEQINPN